MRKLVRPSYRDNSYTGYTDTEIIFRRLKITWFYHIKNDDKVANKFYSGGNICYIWHTLTFFT